MPIPTERITIRETGGPNVMQFEAATLADPGPGEIAIELTAIGLNFIDVYFRTGLYPAPSGLPFTPGKEGAGKVIAVGDDVEDLQVGDRVAYVGALGAYARHAIIPAKEAVIIPDGVSDETAAAIMLKGMTARYLLRKTYDVTADTTLLFHAAAGGVGQLAGQWARHIGATTIGTAGSDEKCALALTKGYEHCINYATENFVDRVRELTDGDLCHVVYDSVGKATFPASLDCLRPFGMFVSFGNASGPVDSFSLALLAQKGSLFATRPTLFAYIATREMYVETANDLFDVVAKGAVSVDINQRFPLAEAAAAHEALEARRTTGATILMP